jgi:hypothetical protein
MQRYMIIEKFHPQKIRELYERFDKVGRLLPEGVHFIDSWIDEKVQICFQLMESESPDLLKQWTERWKDFTSFEIFPVIDSAEAKKRVFSEK